MPTAAEMNDIALAAAIDDLRDSNEARLVALENNVETLRGLVQSQTQVIGEALGRLMGRGSTVADPTPEDLR
jgi:hypothetical protein